jgi:glycosyltransferase involved in cell wall biosynthesis
VRAALIFVVERIAATWIRVARWIRVDQPRTAHATVDVIGFLESASGLGSAARGIVETIEKWAPKEISISRVSPSNRLSESINRSLESAVVDLPKRNYAIHLYNPDVFFSLMLRYGPTLLTQYGTNLIVVNWETERLPSGWRFILQSYDKVAAPSRFTALAVQQAMRRGVHVIPNYVAYKPARVRGSECQEFVFLVMFDALSSVWRKNPRAAVLAFSIAKRQFASGVTARLRVKCHAHTDPNVIRAIIEGHESADVEVIAETLSSSAMETLWAETDCLISLHRSEGFGLPVAEALARGIPVIATRQGGVLDFATDDNAFLVDGTGVRGADPAGVYKECSGWREPSVEAAAAFMVQLVTDYAVGVRKAAAGRLSIQQKCGAEAVRNSIYEALLSHAEQ